MKKETLTENQKILIFDDWQKNHFIRPKIQLVNEKASHWNCLTVSVWLKPLWINIEPKNNNAKNISNVKKSLNCKTNFFEEGMLAGNSFLIDGDDSSDEEMIAYQYANYDLNKQYELFKENSPKFLEKKDPNSYSFYAFAKGLELLYSPKVNQYYYAKKRELGEHKIYIADKELKHDEQLMPWIEGSINDTLENCIKLFKRDILSNEILNSLVGYNKNKVAIKDFIQKILNHKRSLFRLKACAEILPPDIKKYLPDLVLGLSSFISNLEDNIFKNLKITFKINEFAQDDNISDAVCGLVRKYIVSNDLVDKDNKLLAKKELRDKLSKLKDGANRFEKKLLERLDGINRQNINNILSKYSVSFCTDYLTAKIKKELARNKPILKRSKNNPDEYFFISNDVEISCLKFFQKANEKLVKKYFPKSISDIKRSLKNKIKNKFEKQFIINLYRNKEKFQIQIVRPILPAQYCFHSDSPAEFLANLRLSYRDQKRQIRQAEDDSIANPAYKYRGEKFHRSWQFGDLKEMALENEEITSGLTKRDKVINLGRYKIVYEELKEIRTSINEDLKSQKQKKISDGDLARWIKNIIQHQKSISFTYKDDTNVCLNRFQEKELKKILVNVVYLIFGCEALRNPASLVTQAIMIDRVEAKDMSWKSAFFGEISKKVIDKTTKAPISYGGGKMPMSMGAYKDQSEEKKKSEPVAAARTLQKNYGFFAIKAYAYPGDALKEEKPEELNKIKELARREKKLLEEKLEQDNLDSVTALEDEINSWYDLGKAYSTF